MGRLEDCVGWASYPSLCPPLQGELNSSQSRGNHSCRSLHGSNNILCFYGISTAHGTQLLCYGERPGLRGSSQVWASWHWPAMLAKCFLTSCVIYSFFFVMVFFSPALLRNNWHGSFFFLTVNLWGPVLNWWQENPIFKESAFSENSFTRASECDQEDWRWRCLSLSMKIIKKFRGNMEDLCQNRLCHQWFRYIWELRFTPHISP